MASTPLSGGPLSPGQLLTLGLFVFGMDTAAYDSLTRRMGWRHATAERHMARPASQYVGPGEDMVTISGLIVPEIAGTYGALERLQEMAGTGEDWPLVDGTGRVLGHFIIVSLEEAHHDVMAGGLPRAKSFSIELQRVE